MAMPTTGCIALKTCLVGCACSSICVAVGYVGTASLSAISVDAGKTAPHCMREFYGYSTGLDIRVDTQWNGPCGAGNGMCGGVYLKCGAAVICSSCIIGWQQGECQYNWAVPTGTYCVKWCNFCSCGGGSRITDITWDKNNPAAGGGGTTSVTTSSFSASGCIQGCATPIF